MARTITIDISGLDELRAELANFDITFITWLQVAMIEILLPKLKEIVPVRTGNLRSSRSFYPTGRGGAFGWDNQGYYWRFQEGLEERSIQIAERYVPVIARFARDQTIKELRASLNR